MMEIAIEPGINPDRLYTADEVAELFGYSGEHARRRIYDIPDDELVRTRLGPKGGAVRFRGRDVLGYMDSRREAP